MGTKDAAWAEKTGVLAPLSQTKIKTARGLSYQVQHKLKMLIRRAQYNKKCQVDLIRVTGFKLSKILLYAALKIVLWIRPEYKKIRASTGPLTLDKGDRISSHA